MPWTEIIPDFVTHYYLASRAPFLNLSDLPDDQVTTVMADLTRERREGAHKRPFGRTYIEMPGSPRTGSGGSSPRAAGAPSGTRLPISS